MSVRKTVVYGTSVFDSRTSRCTGVRLGNRDLRSVYPRTAPAPQGTGS